MPELRGRCTSCGNSNHKSVDCKVKKNKVICGHCGKPGHLAKICFSALRQNAKRDEGSDRQTNKQVRAVAPAISHDHNSDSSGQEAWSRLPLRISQSNGHFTFDTFPDTGSAATLISSDIVKRKSMVTTGETSALTFVNVSGDVVPTEGIVPVMLSTNTTASTSKAIVSSAIKNEVIVGREDLQQLAILSKRFPEPIMVISQERFDKFIKIRDQLIRNHPTVLTNELHTESLEGCVMKIHLTPGEKLPFHISTARQVLLHWKEKAERVVKKLISKRVITPQEEPTKWCTPGFFVIKKNGDLRLVVDYTHLLLKTGPTDFLAALAAWRNTFRNNRPSPNEQFFREENTRLQGCPIALSQLTCHTEVAT